MELHSLLITLRTATTMIALPWFISRVELLSTIYTTLFYEDSPEYQAQADVRPERLTLAFLNNLVSGPNIIFMTLTLMFLLTKKMRYTMEQAVRMNIREEREIMVIVFFSYCL